MPPARATLLLILVAIPLLEVVLLFKVGQAIGFWWTLLIVIGTGVAGTILLRRQGIGMLRKIMESDAAGTPPVAPVLDGMLVALAAVLLITPGIVADLVGLVLLLPPVRALAVSLLSSRMVFGGFSSPGGRPGDRSRDGHYHRPDPDITVDEDGIIIEGEYTRLDERTVDPKRGPRKPGS